jgi:uncharacterized protein YndB with AHSA1/START domain
MAARKTEFTTPPGEPIVVITRVFDAPRRLVFEAMTRPEHVSRWYGPHGFEVVSCEIDLRPGGAYRFVQRAPDGNDYAFRGVYREVVPPARLVSTWIFEMMPDKETLVTMTLEERGGKTTLTSTMRFPTVEDRDAYLGAGAAVGASESMERLDEVLRDLA